MTEEQIRELVVKMRRAADRKTTDILYIEEIDEAADVIEALAAPVDEAEIQATLALTRFSVSTKDYLEAARQARLARIQP